MLNNQVMEKKPRVRIDFGQDGSLIPTKSAIVKVLSFVTSQPNLEVEDNVKAELALLSLPVSWRRDATNPDVKWITFEKASGESEDKVLCTVNDIITECWLKECVGSELNQVIVNIYVDRGKAEGIIKEVVTSDDFV